MRRAALLVISALVASGCRTEQTLVTPHPHLERMLKQEKVLPYEDAPMLPHDMAMQLPPDDALPVDTLMDDPMLDTGAARGHYAERIPIRLDRAVLDRGRHDFDTFCAACHGVLGAGDSVVARKMNLRKPANLLGEARGYPPGQVFQVIRLGYGLMPSYVNQLSVEDSWAVVAYVRALQLAQGAPVDRLPPALRTKLEAQR